MTLFMKIRAVMTSHAIATTCFFALAAAALPIPATARIAPRNIPVPTGTSDNLSGIDLSVDLERYNQRGVGASSFAQGERMIICVFTSQDGYITIWDKDPHLPHPMRIYPNDRTERSQLGGFKPAGRTCYGDEDDSYNFLIEGTPAGPYTLGIYWAPKATAQFSALEFPVVPSTPTSPGVRARDLNPRSGGAPNDGRVHEIVQYRVTQ